MKINDEFSLDRDTYNFTLTRHTPFEAYTKGDKEYPAGVSETKTYYPTIQSAMLRLVQKGIVTDDIGTILASIDKSTTDIITSIEKDEK